MAHYRLYFLGSDGHIKCVVDLDCAGDDDAIARVGAYEIGHGLELWSGTRRVLELRPH